MPPVETYAVSFKHGNLHPEANANNWPDMQQSSQVPGVSESVAESIGIKLRCVRDATVPSGTRVMNQLSVTPPRGAVPLDCRIFLSATFDLPYALPLPDSPKFPEPWAVALTVYGDGGGVRTEAAVHVTCQFNRKYDGVRLNTPSGLQQSPVDQGRPIDSPLDYRKWQYRRINRWLYLPARRFTLEHAFCGWGLRDHGHVTGSGSLTMRDWRANEVRDHRVYSSADLSGGERATTHIRSVGVALVTVSGVGEIGVRMRSFSVSFNVSAEPHGDPVLPVPTPH